MKKFKHFAYVGAIALLSMVGFTACSSSDDVAVEPNPTFDGESVKTQFTISLPENINKMRMTSATVQEGGNFRGIDNIKLVPYSLGAAAASGVQGTENSNANLISLSPIDVFDKEESNSKVYADVSLEVGTSNFLFYGKAADGTVGTAITSPADKFKYGALTVAGLDDNTAPDLDEMEFTPVQIYGDYGNADEQTAINNGKTVGTNLIAALNAVADATPTEDLSVGIARPKFKEVTAAQDATINQLAINFLTLETGSSKNIEWVFKELYMTLDGYVTDAAKKTVPNAYKMAVAIRAALDNYVDPDITSGVTTSVTLKEALQGYPASVNLPDGAARVIYNATDKEFKAVTDVDYASMNVAALESYVYPANLQYFVNSPVKVANEIKSPNYSGSWANILSSQYSGAGTGTAVAKDTRSVAITNQVQYGVARLDVIVNGLVASTEENPNYYDNTGKAVDLSNGFQLTGILVGGQKSVGWNYVTKGATAYTVYDKTMNGNAAEMTVKRTVSTPYTYTLVLQSGEDAADKTVNVALEFINKSTDFVGADGEIIPHGATFYLVGTLDASTKDGPTAAKGRVFTQDYKTIANFTIKQGTAVEDNDEGLGTATKGLPDLRTPHMELGLSVDLTWEEGLEFDVEI